GTAPATPATPTPRRTPISAPLAVRRCAARSPRSSATPTAPAASTGRTTDRPRAARGFKAGRGCRWLRRLRSNRLGWWPGPSGGLRGFATGLAALLNHRTGGAGGLSSTTGRAGRLAAGAGSGRTRPGRSAGVRHVGVLGGDEGLAEGDEVVLVGAVDEHAG